MNRSLTVHDLDKLVLAFDVQPLHRGAVSDLALLSFSSTLPASILREFRSSLELIEKINATRKTPPV